MNIRPATPADARAIMQFWNPMIGSSLVTFNSQQKTAADIRAMIRDRQNAGYAFQVFHDGSEILGFATYSQFRGGIGYARTMEHTVIVSPKAQGRGIARALMLAIEEHARDAGAHSMLAGVSGENPPGVAFHQALGYREVAVIPDAGFKFDRWIDLHLLQKLL